MSRSTTETLLSKQPILKVLYNYRYFVKMKLIVYFYIASFLSAGPTPPPATFISHPHWVSPGSGQHHQQHGQWQRNIIMTIRVKGSSIQYIIYK